MKITRKGWLAVGVTAILVSTAALGAGLYSTLPLAGGNSACVSTVSGVVLPTSQGSFAIVPGSTQGTGQGICGQTAPSGPAITGNETFPADTNLTSGQNPATERIQTGALAPQSIYQGSFPAPKNLLRNGDISVNPFQVGTSQASNISNTITTAADGFRMLGGASSAIQWSKQSGATDVVAGQFTSSLRFQRASANADTGQVCQINVLTSQDSVALAGQTFVYSFWAKAGANFSPTNGNVVVSVAAGTGTDQSAANFKSASWTNQTNEITAAGSSSSSFPVSIATAQATVQVLPSGVTAAWQEYWVVGVIPTAIAGSNTNQVGTSLCWTPVGTAGANDWVETANHQLEIVGTGVITPTAFEHHIAGQDLAAAQRFLYVISEGAAANVRGLCRSRTVTTCSWDIRFPVPMRAAATMTYANGFAVETTVAGGTLNNCTLAADTTVATAAATNIEAFALCTATTVPAAGTVDQVYDNGGSGKVTATAEL